MTAGVKDQTGTTDLNRYQQISTDDFNETLSDHLANIAIIFCD